MPRAGGHADKLGNQYEAIWTVDVALNVFFGKALSITVEAYGDESQGVEFHLVMTDKKFQFHSLKRQKRNGDWSVAELCKPRVHSERSILGDLFNKRRVYDNAELKFVSATGANQLRELTERAATLASLAEFQNSIKRSTNLQSDFDNRIVPICRGDHEFAFNALKSLEVVLVSQRELTRRVEQRISENFYRKDGNSLEAADFRRMIAEFVLENLGPPISSERIGKFIDSNGFGTRNWKTDKHVNDLVKKLNNRYLTVTEADLVNSAQIVRDEANQMFEEISKPESQGVLLVAPGGYGKSCVIAQFLSRLTTHGIPAIVLRIDSLEPCQTSRQIGEQLDLPASPILVLAGIADNSRSVIIIDQLDAVSLVSGRHPKMWEVFQELKEEASTYPQMKIVLACRDFDLRHDYRLRQLGEEQSGFKKMILDRLSTQDVRKSLAVNPVGTLNLSEKQLAILGVPFHLLLFIQGQPSNSFSSVGQLYDSFWSRKQTNLYSRLGREAAWNDVVDTLTARMSDRQVLFAPIVLVDKWQLDAKAMVSEHVLVEVQGQYRFFHESFFDYAYARGFCSTGASLVEFLSSGEQHLFRRAQVRQILAYRRENDVSQYIADAREIFDSNSVRFHIKCMVASGFRQVIEPTRDEWEVVKPHLFDCELSRYVSQALRNHVGWFDLLDRLNVFQHWLDSNDEQLINATIWFFEGLELQDRRSSRIAELLTPYINGGVGWRKHLIRLMSWGKAHKSNEMSRIYLNLITQGVYEESDCAVRSNDQLWGHHHSAAKECPKFIIDVLATWFDRTVEKYDDGKARNFFDNCRSNHSHVGSLSVGNVALCEPAYFVEQMLPRVIATILKTEIIKDDSVRNRAWPLLTNSGDPFDIHDAILLYLRKALQWLSVNDIETFRTHSRSMTTHPHETLGYLLLRSWAENPNVFADECAEYLVADQRRLNIGYSICFGNDGGNGESAISRIALQSISPYCSDKMFSRLENAIIGYCDEYEKQTPRQRGFAELLVLRSLDRTKLSEKTELRIEELQRKFPTVVDTVVREDVSSLATFVGSPIAEATFDLMTDRQIIGAMQKYDGSTDRFGGGPVELSRLMTRFVRRDRERFASLVEKMPECIDPIYFSAILDGLSGRVLTLAKEAKESDQKNIEATPTKVFLKVIDRLHSLPNRPCGTAVLGCVRILSERQLPLKLLEIVSHYAIFDPEPTTDIWRKVVNDRKAYDGDPQFYGINCVRGQAAGAIADLICDDESRLAHLRVALISLSSDPIIAVRACAVEALTHLLKIDPGLAINLFLKACEGCIEICQTSNFDHFVYYAASRHYSSIASLLQFSLNSDCVAAVEIAAGHIILSELFDVDVGSHGSEIRSGNETMRSAAATVYANYISNAQVGNTCSDNLEMFFDDPSKNVRDIVSRSFFNISGTRLLELTHFISRFIESKSFESETDRLLYALAESNAELPHVICRAAERILEFIGVDGTNIAHRGSMVAMNISTLVVRQYEQTTDDKIKVSCLDLIDSIERAGLLGIGDELNKIDR